MTIQQNQIGSIQCISTDVLVVGAGLTGLTVAYWLTRQGHRVHVVERQSRVGGQIQTHRQGGYVFESGPTTGSVSTPEVAELMADLAETSAGRCLLETAPDAAKRRLIWKHGRFHALPSGPWGGLTTPLFSFSDKLRILTEPWRKKGMNPDETIAELTCRRLGHSFLDYAVDPFVSGVYAGNPHQLVTRHALPKLYRLEQEHGSFIRGAMAKARQPKEPRERLATQKVFSAKGGLETIPQSEAEYIGYEHISLGADSVTLMPEDGMWRTTFHMPDGMCREVLSRYVVTTSGAYTLPDLLPFIETTRLEPITRLVYAPIMEVAVGLSNRHQGDYLAFGGLVPTCERRDVLGVLFPSTCFSHRAPDGSVLFSVFIGGIKHPEMLRKSDGEIVSLVKDTLRTMLGVPADVEPDLIRIFRHEHAIPQYGADSDERLSAVERLESEYPGLILAGNLRDGIGMGHRMTQAMQIAEKINKSNK